MNYQNQKRINIKNFNEITHKEHTNKTYLQPINWEYYLPPLQLSGNAFKLWFYLLKWVGQGYYDFSPANLQKELNIKSKNTIYTIKEELITNHYLKQCSENLYEFYPGGYYSD